MRAARSISWATNSPRWHCRSGRAPPCGFSTSTWFSALLGHARTRNVHSPQTHIADGAAVRTFFFLQARKKLCAVCGYFVCAAARLEFLFCIFRALRGGGGRCAPKVFFEYVVRTVFCKYRENGGVAENKLFGASVAQKTTPPCVRYRIPAKRLVRESGGEARGAPRRGD